jgi:parallel beta-helix repeat protein
VFATIFNKRFLHLQQLGVLLQCGLLRGRVCFQRWYERHIVAQSGATVKFNAIVFAYTSGIMLDSSGSTVESNTITDGVVGIEFNCHTGNTVSGNTIRSGPTGIDKVPSTQTVTNTYYNVDAIQTDGC